MQGFFDSGAGSTILGYLNLFSGQALQNLSLFALGIMPYITASIIIQLLQVVIPSLEKLRKEGEAGQKRITQYTRYLTVALAALQSAGYVFLFHNGSVIGGTNILPDLTVRSFLLIVLTLTAGTTLLMWMGELITQRGVGNGMSLLIFASILTSVPVGGAGVGQLEHVPAPVAADRDPRGDPGGGVHQRGPAAHTDPVRETHGRPPHDLGRRTYMPLRVNMAGVIPVIFAVAVLFFPPTLGQLIPSLAWLAEVFAPTTWPSIILEFALIVVFTFFYTAVQFNPTEQADNLKKYGGFIPGVRRAGRRRSTSTASSRGSRCRARSTWGSSRCCRRSSSATPGSRRPWPAGSAARPC